MPTPSSAIREAITRPWGGQDNLLLRTLAGGVRLLRGQRAAPETLLPAPVAASIIGQAAPGPLPAVSRRIWADRLWGEGLRLPGGTEELLRLASLLPLRKENTLLLAGLGALAAGGVVPGSRGCFVAAHDLLAEEDAPPPRGPAARRVTRATLAPDAPAFRLNYHDHAMLLEPLRHGGSPAGLLRRTAEALRSGGDLVLFELVATDPTPDRAWLKAEARQAPPPVSAMPAALKAAGFHVHVVEDAGLRQQRAVLEGWLTLLESLRAGGARPAPQEAAALVREAEAWLLRLRLLGQGRLRLLRWHATKRGSLA